MADMAQAGADVYAPRSPQLWGALLNWLCFFFQILAQIVRGTPSLTQVLSYLGFRNSSFLSSPPPEFKPLGTVELSDFPEPDEAPPPPPSVAVQPIAKGRVAGCDGENPLPRLTVWSTAANSGFLCFVLNSIDRLIDICSVSLSVWSVALNAIDWFLFIWIKEKNLKG